MNFSRIAILILINVFLLYAKELKLNNQSSITAQLGKQGYKVNLLVDPMSKMTYIFESKIPKAVFTSSRTGIKKNITNSYGRFTGEFATELIKIGQDPSLSFKLGFLLVQNTTSPLITQYDGIIGLGQNELPEYSIFNQTNIRPIMTLNLKKGTINLGENSSFKRFFSTLFHVKKSDKGLNVYVFDLNSIKSNKKSTSGIKGNGKLDLWQGDYIMAPFDQEKNLFFGYFNETTKGGLIYTDETKKNGYNNYFFPLGYAPKKKVQSFIEIDNQPMEFASYYKDKTNDIAYSTIKLLLEKDNQEWMVGVNALGYDTFDFDYEQQVIYAYNHNTVLSIFYSVTGVLTIISIGFLIWFFYYRKLTIEKTVDETELIDKSKPNPQKT